jgi:hypothetical protein
MPSSEKGKHSRTALILAPVLLILLTIFASEMVLRVYFNLFPPVNYFLLPADKAGLHIFTPSEQGGFYSVKPNFKQDFINHEFKLDVRTNNIGLREDQDYFGEPVDIGFIGESFTFGWGVDAGERYSDIVRDAFEDQLVLSYSYPNGHAPAYYLSFLQDHPEMIPKVLVLGLFAFNDLASDTTDTEMLTDMESGLIQQVKSRTLKVDENGFIVNKDETPPRLFSAGWFIRNTAIGRTYNVAKHRMKASPNPIEKPDELKPLDLGQMDETALTALGQIRKIDQLAKDNDSTLVIFYIPFASDISDYPTCKYSQSSCETIRKSNALGTSLASWAQQNGIHFIDPVNDFRSREQAGEKLYYYYDGHWTTKGHAAAGSLIEQYLRAEQLISSD